jgi:hypothetical protein
MLRKNVAGQFLTIAAVNATTGAALTGATVSMRRCLDGTFAAGGATITEDTGLGFYKVALTQADTNGNNVGYFFTATNMIPINLTGCTTAADPTDSVRFGLTALPNAAAGANTGLPVVGTQVPNATAGAANGLLISGGNSGTTTFGAMTVTGALTVSDGVIITASTSGRNGIISTGNGTGSGVRFVGGSSNGIGASLAGVGTGNGLNVAGGTTAVGAVIVGGGTSGDGLQVGSFGGNGLAVFGGGAFSGAVFTSGAGATGDGIQVTATSTNGNGLKLTKTGSGLALSGATTDLTLAKTTNITGFNDIAATAVVSSGAITTSGGAVTTVTNVTTNNDKTGYSLTATTGLGNQTANITGNLSGSVGSVTGAVGSVTGAVGSVTGAVGSVAGTTGDFTTALTESYAADGATFTPAQALYMIWSKMAEMSISTTTMTTKKLDGSTQAMTFTLNDATTPSSITRAT